MAHRTQGDICLRLPVYYERLGTKDTDEHPDEDVHLAGRVLSIGASVSWGAPLSQHVGGFTTLKLSKLHSSGVFMEA